MKAFESCDRRVDGQCIQYQHPCAPGMELPISGKGIEGCWRICREGDKFLQCPSCRERLWFDNYVANSFGGGDIFYCPKCDKDVNRAEAIQTVECIACELKEQEKVLQWFDALSLAATMELRPRELDDYNRAKYQVKRLQALIVEVAQKAS